VIARANEAVVANIDSSDLALLGVLTVLGAVLVFGIDRVRDLSPSSETWAFGLLGLSAFSCIVGYIYGQWRTRDSIDASSFLFDFATDPQGTTANATRGSVEAYRRNVRDRTVKRWAVTVALLLLVAGTILVAVARSG
jgi:hypothetical protein